jgi:hypothetical protein
METSKQSTGETLFDLTSYVVDTPANHFRQQESAMALMTHDTYGLGFEKPLANYDLDTQSWRMYEATLLSDSPKFLGIWPASGTTRNGKLFPQTLLVRHISESELSFWPTPTVDDSKNVNPKPNRMWGLVAAVNQAPTPSGNWPTPTTADVYTDNLKSSQQTDGSMHSVSLGQAVQMWPTPTTMDYLPPRSEEALERQQTNNRPGRTTPPTLKDAVAYPEKWPTPKASDYKAAVIWPQSKTKSRDMALRETIAERSPEMIGGKLNPMWVEWLMGFPLGWTDLED